MLRYNKQYQAIADEFARKEREDLWIGAYYLGHYHEPIPPGSDVAPAWLAFEPINKYGEDLKEGIFHYIFINEEELVYYTTLRVPTNKTILFDMAYDIQRQKIHLPKPVKYRSSSRNNQYVVAITAERE